MSLYFQEHPALYFLGPINLAGWARFITHILIVLQHILSMQVQVYFEKVVSWKLCPDAKHFIILTQFD